jgi:predicted O-methyltransferase YrrM
LTNFASKVATAAWFLRRPAFWRQAGDLVRRKFMPDMDGAEQQTKATEWAAQRAVPVNVALSAVGLLKQGKPLPKLSRKVLAEAERLAKRATVEMGGAADLSLIHAAARLAGARRAVETGVAYGWSSLAILTALAENGGGRLASVDMPYPKMHNEPFVGIVVPDRLRANWTLIRLPDRNGLKHAIAQFEGTIDFAHYDSDKSYYGRSFAYPLIWKALAPGGVFISDDIQDNLRFAEFVAEQGVPFAVTGCAGRFVGICRKP